MAAPIGPTQAAPVFDPESAAWDNKGPAVVLTNGGATVRLGPGSGDMMSGWHHVRAGCVLTVPDAASDGSGADVEGPADGTDGAPFTGLFEWTLQIEHLAHSEFFLGVVDPDKAPRTPYCLHRCASLCVCVCVCVCQPCGREAVCVALWPRGPVALWPCVALCCHGACGEGASA